MGVNMTQLPIRTTIKNNRHGSTGEIDQVIKQEYNSRQTKAVVVVVVVIVDVLVEGARRQRRRGGEQEEKRENNNLCGRKLG